MPSENLSTTRRGSSQTVDWWTRSCSRRVCGDGNLVCFNLMGRLKRGLFAIEKVADCGDWLGVNTCRNSFLDCFDVSSDVLWPIVLAPNMETLFMRQN